MTGWPASCNGIDPTDAPKALKRTGLVAGATAGAIGLAYATERALVARLRHRDDPDAGDELVPEFDEARILDSHDGGTIYTISRGEGPLVVFCHGVTLSSRVWAKQFASFPAAGFRAVAFDSPWPRRVDVPAAPATRSTTSPTTCAPSLEELDLHDVVLVGHSMGGMAVQVFAIRHPAVVAERVSGLVLLSTLVAQPGERRQARARRLERMVNVGPDVACVHASAQPRTAPRPRRIR